MGKLIQPKSNFTIVSNHILRDKAVSLQSKGLYTLMRALPDKWNFSSIGLASLSSNGRDATRNCLIELEQNGYLKRTQYKDENGQFDVDYELYNKAYSQSTAPENPSSGFPSSESQAHNIRLENQDVKNNTRVNTGAGLPAQDEAPKPPKPERKKPVFKSDLKQIAEVIKAMEAVDPKNKLYYGNTTQKGAVDFLLVEYGLDAVLGVIRGIPQARMNVKFFPSITTPCELRDKWVKAFEALNRKRMDSQPVIKKQSV